jgi:peptidoglycan/xylan/chitin deacetylase (PgdA/CDA1 family)
MHSRVRVRWDRVCILLAAVTVLVIVVGHAVASILPDNDADADRSVPPAAAEPVAAPVGKPCPSAASAVLRTAPHEEGQRTVALTFDDGPGTWTDDILAVLAREDVKATFFVVGREVAAAPEQVRQLFAAGHAVENHSWSHPSAGRGGRWNPELIGKQIQRTSAEITEVTGQPPCFFRPPQGVVPGAEDAARAAGLTIALWSVDTKDGTVSGARGADRIRARARTGLDEPNPIVLLHDGGGDRRATLAALPGIIEDYRRAGYAFVTLGHGRL